jgi:hypothetical protein
MSTVAVWMPVYNESKHLKGAIESVLESTYTDFKLIISDNHSTDDSLNIAQGYAKLDARVEVIQPPEFLAGIPHMKFCWEYLDTHGSQDYTITLGGHDLWMPTYLETMMARMTKEQSVRIANPLMKEVAILYAQTYQLDESNAVVGAYMDIMQIGQIPRHMIPHFALTGLNSPHFFGLWNEKIRRRCAVRHSCGGFDHLIVAEAALHGAIMFEGNTSLGLRGPPPPTGPGLEYYGNKHFSKERLAAGYQDYLDQLEWYLHLVDDCLDEMPQQVLQLYRAMLTSSMVGIYIALRGQNLTAIAGAQDVFYDLPEIKAVLGGCLHIEHHIRALIAKGVKIDD